MSGVETIVADVRERGDAALADWAERFDGVEPARAEPAGELPEEARARARRRSAPLARAPAARPT